VTVLSNTKGGIFSFTTSLIQTLLQRDCLVTVIFLSQARESKLPDSKYLRVKYLTVNSVPNLPVLFNFLFRNDSDILQVNLAGMGALAIWKRLLFKTPFVLTEHGIPQPSLEHGLRNKFAYSMESLLLPFVARFATEIIEVSDYARRALRVKYGLDSKVIYHGISLKEHKRENKEEAKAKLGCCAKDPTILFVGSLNQAKDPMTLIRAFSHVVRVRNSYLLIVGAGELSEEIADAVRELGIQDNVRLLGRLPHEELNRYYSAADIFVLPSLSEAFGIVLLEAMAFGLPAVVSSAGACSEIIGDAGVSFKEGDHAALAERIFQLMQDKELSNRLGRIGLKRVKEIFSIEKEADQYWRLFEKILSERSVRLASPT